MNSLKSREYDINNCIHVNGNNFRSYLLNTKTHQSKFYEPDIHKAEWKFRKPHQPNFEYLDLIHQLWFAENSMTDVDDTVIKRTINQNIRGLVTVNLVKDDFQSRCLVETVLNDQNVIALIDSGADSCYISEEMCKKANVFVEPYSCDVLVGNKEKLDVVGKVSVSILLAQYEYKINCIVARHLTRDLILGWNGFIKVYNGTINAEDETFELDPPKRLSNIVYIEDNVTLNPYTETVLNVKTKETINTDLVTINRYDPLLKE